jgi:hypothetical protein
MSTELQPPMTANAHMHACDSLPFDALSFSCQLCGEVIGVYEPLVVCQSSHSRTTSRAAEPDLCTQDGAHYHRACYSEFGVGPS